MSITRQELGQELNNELNNIDSQINTLESQTILENYLSVHSIPSTAKRGKLDVKLKGLSTVNMVKNGNFANGIVGWTATGGSLSALNNIASLTNGNTYTYSLLNQSPNGRPYKGNINDKIYVKANVRVTNSNCNYIKIYTNDGVDSTQGIAQNTPIQNNWYNLSGLITLPRNNDFGIWIMQSYTDTTIANGKVLEVQNFIGVNLTQLFGAGNEPTKEQCDLMFANYFDGLQGASNITVKSTGKNLFDSSKLVNYVQGTALSVVDNKITITTSATGGYHAIIKVKKNTNYFISNITILGSISVRIYTHTFSALLSNGNETFNSGDNDKIAVYVRNTTEGIGTVENVQLEEGTVATAYEPYKSTEITYKTLDGQPITLNRLPNGVCDEITKDGKLVKRVAEYTLVASDITAFNATFSNFDYISMTRTNFPNIYAQTTTANTQSILIQGFRPASQLLADSADRAWESFDWSGQSISIGITVPKGTYANLATAQTALAGTKIIYQLAQPIIYDTNAIPLIAEPNGTLFITSTASPQPSAELSYPINLNAIVDGLINGQKELSGRFNNLDKSEWITATLQNGWTGTLQYRRNQIGQLEIKSSNLASGTLTSNTIIAKLAIGYMPQAHKPIIAFKNTDGAILRGFMLNTGGEFKVYGTEIVSGTTYSINEVVN